MLRIWDFRAVRDWGVEWWWVEGWRCLWEGGLEAVIVAPEGRMVVELWALWALWIGVLVS